MAFGIGLNIVDSLIVSPKLFGEMLRLPMFIVLLALLFGSVLMGVWGALIATPVAVAVQVIIRDQVRGDLGAEPG